MLVHPIQISGWVNGNLYTPTTEVLGILPIPDTVRTSSGMAMYVPLAGKDKKYQFLRSLHSPLFSVWIPYGMGGFQPHSMDCIWTIFWLATQPFYFSIPTMESIWNAYGMVPSICSPWTGPYGFHGISSKFILQIHVLFHMDSME